MSWGGQGMRILTESMWMRQQGHQVVIIAPANSRLHQEAQLVELATYALPFTKSRQACDLVRLIQILNQLRPDILNTHSSVDSWVGCLAGALCRLPAIIRTRHLGKPVHAHLLNRWLYGSLCHHVFTTGNSISHALRTNLSLADTHVSSIPTGIQPPTDLLSVDTARQIFIQELHLSPKTKFIGCLAVLRQGKGHSILIKAFHHIHTQFPHHHLLLFGEGGYRQVLETLIKDLGLEQRVHLTGYRSDPWQALRALDIHVLASTSVEGTPQAILQAQFANCPVIGTKSGGIKEVISHKQTGLLVPPGEAAPLAKALLHLLTHQKEAVLMARHAQQQVQSHYTLDQMGTHILSIYRHLLAKRA